MRKLFRLYLDEEIGFQKSLFLIEKKMHYLLHVLRLKLHDKILIFNGRQGEWEAEIEHITKKEVILNVCSMVRSMPETSTINFIFSPLKGGALSFLCEKATELGVTDLYPVWFERTQGRDFKKERFEAVIQEAAEQCERLTLPTLHSPRLLENFLSIWHAKEYLFVCDERRNAIPLWDIIHQPIFQDKDTTRNIMIGPEGGFTSLEFEILSRHCGIHFVSLGSTVLRAETAGICALSVLGSQLYSYKRSIQ